MITDDCDSSTPCECCSHGRDSPLCDTCDPCNSNQVCAYCGNGFSRCDPMIDTEDGPKHRDCAVKESRPPQLVEMDDTKEVNALKDELSHAHAQILWYEEELENTRDKLHRFIEGEAADWEEMGS